MESVETIFILLLAAILLVGLAQKMHVPYPVALVLGGAAIGFTPVLHPINFNPDLVLLIILPPILYYAAFGIAFREFQLNWRTIFSLALGLVVCTTVVIGIIFKLLFPQFSWPLAFAFGAIVSPPDAVTVTTILKRFSISSRLTAILEGESLVNDASAIVLYKLAVAALLSGTFSVVEGGRDFLQQAFGGIALGFVSGYLFQQFSKRYLEPVLGVVFSFTIPYITFMVANELEVSGVLAVVVNGLIGSRIILTHQSPLRRVLGYAVWDIFIILLNCFVFILIGLQLRTITSMMTEQQMLIYSGYAVLITLTMIIVRMIWVYAQAGIAYFKAMNQAKWATILREATLIGWSGMRGIVSLSVAIGLPYTLSNGMPLEGRNDVIFMTFVVILITLLLPGLSLPALIRWLKIESTSKKYNEHHIRNQLAKVVEEKLHYLLSSGNISRKEHTFLREYFISHHRMLEMTHEAEHKLPNFEIARIKIIQTQRKKLMEMWELSEIDDKLLTHLENELDIIAVHIARGELD